MTKEHPNIIAELTKAAENDQLRHFDLSSFMTGPPLKEVYKKIDRSMTFFSVYVAMEHLQENLWEDSRYVDKEKVHLCSLVEEEVRRYWWDRNTEHLNRIDELMELYKNDSNYSKMPERELRDRAIKELDQEIYPMAIERVKEHYQEIYEDKWETYWKKEDPFKKRTEYRYHRRYDMPPPFNHWDSRNPWQQYYFAKNKDNLFYYAQGGSGGSAQRYNHGFYGHLFALLKKRIRCRLTFSLMTNRIISFFSFWPPTQWINCWLMFSRGDRFYGKGKTKCIRQKRKIRGISFKRIKSKVHTDFNRLHKKLCTMHRKLCIQRHEYFRLYVTSIG